MYPTMTSPHTSRNAPSLSSTERRVSIVDAILDAQVRAICSSLADTTLEAAKSRGMRYAGVAFLLYALYRDEGLAGRLLREHGVESGEIRRLMGEIPNCPLEDGEKPVLGLSSRRILKHANDTVEILRYVQGNERIDSLLSKHGISLPELQPTQEQVLAAATTGVQLTRLFTPRQDRHASVDYLSYTRLMLEAALN